MRTPASQAATPCCLPDSWLRLQLLPAIPAAANPLPLPSRPRVQNQVGDTRRQLDEARSLREDSSPEFQEKRKHMQELRDARKSYLDQASRGGGGCCHAWGRTDGGALASAAHSWGPPDGGGMPGCARRRTPPPHPTMSCAVLGRPRQPACLPLLRRRSRPFVRPVHSWTRAPRRSWTARSASAR